MRHRADSTHEDAASFFFRVKIPSIRYPTRLSGVAGDCFKPILCLAMIYRATQGAFADHLFALLGPSPLPPGCGNGLSVR